MPELPEVQTVVSQLGRKVVGYTIQNIWSDWKKAVRPSLEYVRKYGVGAKIIGTRRFGKHIVMDLDNEYSLVIHLKMTGHLLVKTSENREDEAFKDPYNQFIHHKISLSDDVAIDFSDMRKFGWMEIMKTSEVEKLKSIQSLGVDAISDEFTEKVFADILKKHPSSLIGVLLLNQNLIAGIGNIYRSEALFLAGIRPMRIAKSLTKKEIARLHESIQIVLQKALQYRGMSDGDFRDTDGLPGEFQRKVGVYGRHGKPCPKCGTIIQRIKIGQRSAFFCPKCQK